VNRVVETIIRSHVSENQKDWDRYIRHIQFAINSSVHETTRYSPHFLFLARQPSLYAPDAPRDFDADVADPISQYADRFPKLKKIYQSVKEKMIESSQHNEHHYNLRHRRSDFAVGQQVMKRNFVLSKKAEGFSKKLAPYFVGPYLITRNVGNNMFTLAEVDDPARVIGDFNTKDLKRHPRNN